MQVNKYDEDEKNTSFRFSNYKRGLTYIKKYKAKLIIVFLLNFLSIIASLFITKILQYVIDKIIPNNNFERLWAIALLACIFMLIVL